VWLAGWALLRGTHIFALGAAELTPLHRQINEFRDDVGAGRGTNPVFQYFFDVIRQVVDQFTTFLQSLIAQPAFGSSVPALGWLGVVAVVAYVSFAFANAKVALLAVAGFTLLGLQGLWQESMDTLALTGSAVLIALLFAIPVGILAGLSDRANRLVTVVLDLMQTMPTFVYLAPLTLIFLIGPASATIATLIYAAPPTIRLTAHGIRSVSPETVEASRSLGASQWQTLTKVLLPVAKRTIVLGINQTMMAALAMVTIAALIDAPGLGKTVIKALETQDVGTAFNAGLAIVALAIVLDRVTTAGADAKASRVRAPGELEQFRRPSLVVGAVLVAVAVWYSRTYVWAARFPGDGNLGSTIASAADSATDWARGSLSGASSALKDFVSAWLLDPLQTLLAESPWWLMAVVIVSIAAVIGSVRAAVVSAVCLTLLVWLGLWQDAMATLAMVLIATVMVMILGVVFGVWMGRSARADRVIRPILDAAQVMPPFVYLVPFLALFEPTRFTSIAAAVVYASTVAIKITADGVRGIPSPTIEAATAYGASTWQVITKVQLPMARRALVLAANQGLIYVLSMVVVGGLVGAGALGFDVVAGFSQAERYGKGLAAGVAIVLLGVMLDRITHAAAQRIERRS
jgi:glycine betaine/proline transport system permease protein